MILGLDAHFIHVMVIKSLAPLMTNEQSGEYIWMTLVNVRRSRLSLLSCNDYHDRDMKSK
jgi:hypothetical protein